MENKYYSLKDFTEEEIKRAKHFVKMAIIGYYEIKLDDDIDELFEQISKSPFLAMDTFTLQFSINTIGNDILAALGVAKYEQSKTQASVR